MKALMSNQALTTMSSIEIAKLTTKLHKNVLADIKRILEEVDIQPAKFAARYIVRQR